MTDAEDRVHVVFELPGTADGWPPVGTERMWAVPVGQDTARLDNIPFFVRGFASGDVVRFRVEDGVRWVEEAVDCSDNCTIRVVPAGDGHRDEVCRLILDTFGALGVEGEGVVQYGLVALNVPAGADLERVKRLLVRGEEAGRWQYEEGCVTAAWRALPDSTA